MAIEPVPEAVVESAIDKGVVPSPPAPPIATAFKAVALLPKPKAVEPIPVATVSRPKALPHVTELLLKPNAEPPRPLATAKVPNTVTPVLAVPLALHPATNE